MPASSPSQLTFLRNIGIGASLLLVLAMGAVIVTVLGASDQARIAKDRWAAFEATADRKSSILVELEAAIGFGGMLHAFKDFVLRGTDLEAERFESGVTRSRVLIAAYRELGASGTEAAALETLEETIDEYRTAFADAAAIDRSRNIPAQEIDAWVLVEDGPAVAAFNSLRLSQAAEAQAGRFGLKQAMEESVLRLRYALLSIPAMMIAAIAILGLMRALVRLMRLREAEEARLRASEERFRQLFEGSLQGVVVHRDMNPIFANRAFAVLVGVPDVAAVTVETDLLSLFTCLGLDSAKPDEDGPERLYRSLHSRVMAGDIPSWDGRVQVQLRDGRRLWFQELLTFIDWDGEPAVQAAYVDVTERVARERTLLSERDHHQAHATELQALTEELNTALQMSEERQRELHRLSISDPLTGVFNRRHFMARGADELARVNRGTENFLGVAMLDIDHFKKINDTHGHAAGDDALRAFASTCLETLREIDVFGRLGGEEFAVILPETGKEGAEVAAERLRVAASNIVVDGPNGPFSFTVSIGVAVIATWGDSFDHLLQAADEALYSAKESGRNRSVLVEPDTEKTVPAS
ncbi:MAG: diguanylate cyclase [Rhodospirillales bacterium]